MSLSATTPSFRTFRPRTGVFGGSLLLIEDGPG